MPSRRASRQIVLSGALVLSAFAGCAFWYWGRGDIAPARSEHSPARPQVRPDERALPEAETKFAAEFRAGLRGFRQGDAHAAAKAFSKALSIRPHAVQARVNLGFAYVEMGRPAQALDLFARAIDIAPMTANAYYGLAVSLEAKGDIAGAMGAMRTFLHLSEDADPFRRRARAALWEWEAALKSRPDPLAPETEPQDVRPPAPKDAGGAMTGVPILDAPLETLDGAPASLAFHSGKIVVLNIWATWCGPCRVELPSLDRLNARLDTETFAVVAVSIDRQPKLVGEYLRDIGFSLPSYWDRTRELTKDLLQARAIPLTLVLSRDGRVLAGHKGARDWSDPEVVHAIRALAADPVPHAERIAYLKEVLK